MRYSIPLFVCAAIFHLLTGAMPVMGAAYLVKPSIAVFEEFTDNVFETPGDRRSDFITRAMPGVDMKYNAPLWDWGLKYTFDYRYYARDSSGDEITHDLNAEGNMRLIKNLLFLDVFDTYKRVSLDVNRDRTVDSLFVNQADQNRLTVAPYVVLRPLTDITVRSGYQYINELYFESSGIDKEEHRAFIRGIYDTSPNLNFSINFNFAKVLTEEGLDYKHFLPYLGINYRYAKESVFFLEGGYSWFLYEDDSSAGSPYWTGGIKHGFGSLIALVNATTTYNTDPLRNSTEEKSYIGRLDMVLPRSKIGLSTSYSELRDLQADVLLSTKYGIRGDIKHRFTGNMAGRFDLAAEKVENKDGNDVDIDITPPYRFHVVAGIAYTTARDLTFSLDYTYVTYRESIESATNNIEINRVILGVAKAF